MTKNKDTLETALIDKDTGGIEEVNRKEQINVQI